MDTYAKQPRTASRLLSPRDAAARLGVSRSTIYRLAARREIAFVRIGGQLRFEPHDLEAFLSTKRQAARAEGQS